MTGQCSPGGPKERSGSAECPVRIEGVFVQWGISDQGVVEQSAGPAVKKFE
jgi:hypothetical protein